MPHVLRDELVQLLSLVVLGSELLMSAALLINGRLLGQLLQHLHLELASCPTGSVYVVEVGGPARSLLGSDDLGRGWFARGREDAGLVVVDLGVLLATADRIGTSYILTV